MESSVDAVAAAKPPVDESRSKRSNIFYGKKTGLIDTIMGIKTYLKASLKNDHPEKKHIMALKFKRLKI